MEFNILDNIDINSLSQNIIEFLENNEIEIKDIYNFEDELQKFLEKYFQEI